MVLGYMGDTKYTGEEKILVAMDIGTTHSAVSFAYLYPEDYVRIRAVNRWPGQPESLGSSKIPTLVSYRRGECKACGPEALEYVDDNSYQTAKWFKLHLHPPSMKVSDQPPPYGSPTNSSALEISPLPPGVTIKQVYTDFMKYLMANTRECFEESIPNGTNVWRRLRETMTVVFTTPNGWELSQQGTLRNAAIVAGLMKAENTHRLLDFVTEGEASVHYALAYSQSKTWLFPGSMFAVVDAGGSTVDSTLYECKSTEPKVHLEEVCPSGCVQAGGVFVDRAAEMMLRQKLSGSMFGDDESIGEMVAAFEGRTKRIFDGRQASNEVEFGSSRENDRLRGIIKGKLSLTRQEVEAPFEDVIKRIVESCLELLNGRKVRYIILVGGFGESRYLKKKLSELFDQQGASIVTAEEPSKKAAAEGALILFIKQTVMTRVSRKTLGINARTGYEPGDPEHLSRSARAYTDIEQWNADATKQIRCSSAEGPKIDWGIYHYSPIPPNLQVISERSYSTDVKVWSGEDIPIWCDDVNGCWLPQMRTLCALKADLSGLRGSLKQREGPAGAYYMVDFDVVIKFGGTQLHATIQWKEGEALCEGPVTIIPNAIL